MKIKTIYIADDGKEFDDALACQAYEVEQNHYHNCGFMACINGVTKEIKEADFLYFDEPAEMENFVLISAQLNLTTEGLPELFPTAGYFIWDYDNLTWYRVPDHLGDILYNYYRNK
jgi:hypothetical protein